MVFINPGEKPVLLVHFIAPGARVALIVTCVALRARSRHIGPKTSAKSQGQNPSDMAKAGELNAPSFGSSRFRIRLTERADETLDHQCMHIRGFDLFGAILPPWRIDV